jgi:putative hydrolase of the HAD superfamily
MSSERRTRAITFDFWLTLFQNTQGSVRQELRIEAFMKAAGTPEEETRRAFEVWPRVFYETHIGEQRTLTPRDAVRIVCDELAISLPMETAEELAETFAAAILHYPPEPIEGALEAVRRAAERVPVGLISDTAISPGSSLRVIMDRNGFTPYFGALTFSDEVGVSKPQRPMFERTAGGLGVTTDALLHIGDLEPTDIAGAQAVGGVAALFTGANDRYRENTRADHVFDDWAAFLDRLPDLV